MLSKKAQQLLSKESKTKRSLKFQLGGPTVNIDPTFNPLAGMDNAGYGFDNSNYQMNLNQPLLQDLNTAQNYNYNQIQNNVQAQQQQGPVQPQTPVQQPQGNWMDFAGGAGKIAYGVKSLVEGQKERKNAKIYERISKEENDRRLENQRQTGFVLTPYTNKRTWSMKKGGMYIPMPSPGTYQEGGISFNNNLENFMNSYGEQMEQQQLQNQMFQDHYDNTNAQKKLKWKSMQQQGVQSLKQFYKEAQDTVGKAVGMMQVGGVIPQMAPETSYMNIPVKPFDPSVAALNVQMDTIDPNWATKSTQQLQAQQETLSEQARIANTQYHNLIKDNGSRKIKSKPKFERERQEGGEIEMDQMNTIEQPDTESLYSPDFQSPVQQDFAPEETLKSGLESWIFQDEAPMPDMETAQKYNQSFSPISSSSGYGSNTSSGTNPGSMDIIESIKKHESGGNPEAINMIGASGYYQFTPAWADKIAPFMGLPTGTPKGKVMEAFRKNPQAQDAFMKHVVDNIYMPKIEQLRPYANKYGFNDNEMIKLLHYRGLNDTEKRLKTGNFEVSQDEKRKYNNPDILTYIKSK